jgi:hypothetical protein
MQTATSDPGKKFKNPDIKFVPSNEAAYETIDRQANTNPGAKLVLINRPQCQS